MQTVLPINPLLYSQIDTEHNELIIYYGVSPLQRINLDDKTSLYINAVNLVLCGMKQSEVAIAFGFDRSWLVRLMQIHRESGYNPLSAGQGGDFSPHSAVMLEQAIRCQL